MTDQKAVRYWPHGKAVPAGWRIAPGALDSTHHGRHAAMIEFTGRQLLVGICGPEGGGKSTAARMLCDAHGFAVHPFAGPLKTMLAAIGVPGCHLYGTPAEKEAPLRLFGGKSARHAMQTLGTEWGRQHIGPGFWVEAWRATMPADVGAIVVDDVRFPNEAETIRDMGGIMIRIDRTAAARDVKHASENHRAIPTDFEILNDGSRDELAAGLAHMLAGVKSRV